MKNLLLGLALAALFTTGCGKKDDGGGTGDIGKTCESLVRPSTSDKAKFIDACKKVDPKVVSCVAKTKAGKGSKGDACDKLQDQTDRDTWMGLMMGQLGQ